jgi:hypothetical protein
MFVAERWHGGAECAVVRANAGQARVLLVHANNQRLGWLVSTAIDAPRQRATYLSTSSMTGTT